MIVNVWFPRGWSSLKRLIWLFKAAPGFAPRDPTSDVVNIGLVDYMTLTS